MRWMLLIMVMLAAAPTLAQTSTPTPTVTPTATPTATATPAYLLADVYEFNASFFSTWSEWAYQSGFSSATCTAVSVSGCADNAVIVATPGAAWASITARGSMAVIAWYTDSSSVLNVCVNLSTCTNFAATAARTMQSVTVPLSGVSEIYITASGSGTFGLDRITIFDYVPATATPSPTATAEAWRVVETAIYGGTPVAIEYKNEVTTDGIASVIIGLAQLIGAFMLALLVAGWRGES